MTALLKDPVSYLFHAPAPCEETDVVTITIEALGPRWWILHRSDGKSGGIFDHKAGALHQARIDAMPLRCSIIAIIEPDGSKDGQLYVRGTLSGRPDEPLLKLVG